MLAERAVSGFQFSEEHLRRSDKVVLLANQTGEADEE